jgi:hypothetical protein
VQREIKFGRMIVGVIGECDRELKLTVGQREIKWNQL